MNKQPLLRTGRGDIEWSDLAAAGVTSLAGWICLRLGQMQAEVRRITLSRSWGQFLCCPWFLSLGISVPLYSHSLLQLARIKSWCSPTRKIKTNNSRNGPCLHRAFYAFYSDNSASWSGLKCDAQLKVGRVSVTWLWQKVFGSMRRCQLTPCLKDERS